MISFTTKTDKDGESTIVEEGVAEGSFYNPEMNFRQQELERILFNCLDQLPGDQRSVIIMKEYEGMKFREIAEVLNTSENTIKTWLYRGLKQLKGHLEDKKFTKETLNYEL